VPDTAAIGDIVVVFKGAKFPYILWKYKDKVEEKYTLVGEAYVHRIIYGEFTEQPKESKRKAFRMR
jgi:rRNA processing protein Gar1